MPNIRGKRNVSEAMLLLVPDNLAVTKTTTGLQKAYTGPSAKLFRATLDAWSSYGQRTLAGKYTGPHILLFWPACSYPGTC